MIWFFFSNTHFFTWWNELWYNIFNLPEYFGLHLCYEYLRVENENHGEPECLEVIDDVNGAKQGRNRQETSRRNIQYLSAVLDKVCAEKFYFLQDEIKMVPLNDIIRNA